MNIRPVTLSLTCDRESEDDNGGKDGNKKMTFSFSEIPIIAENGERIIALWIGKTGSNKKSKVDFQDDERT